MASEEIISAYFCHLRPEIIACIPVGCRKLLSVGCGAGLTEGELVRRGVEVIGIELNPEAAELARSRGVNVLQGDVGALNGELQPHRFDCLLYADVLEHLADPLSLLRDHTALLNPGGVVVISVPNFRHYQVFWQLFVRGRVVYAESGIMDKTHLRITTRGLVEDWLRIAGYQKPSFLYSTAGRRDGWLVKCTFGLLREFCARQVIAVATKPDNAL